MCAKVASICAPWPRPSEPRLRPCVLSRPIQKLQTNSILKSSNLPLVHCACCNEHVFLSYPMNSTQGKTPISTPSRKRKLRTGYLSIITEKSTENCNFALKTFRKIPQKNIFFGPLCQKYQCEEEAHTLPKKQQRTAKPLPSREKLRKLKALPRFTRSSTCALNSRASCACSSEASCIGRN